MPQQLTEQTDLDFKKEHILDISSTNLKINKFKKFLSILTYFSKKLFKDNTDKNAASELDPFVTQATSFLNTENYLAYINMIKEGYIPTKNQEKRMDKIVHDLYFYKSNDVDDYGITESEKIIELDNILKLGYKLKQSDVLKFIQHANKKVFYNNMDFFSSNENLSTTCVFKSYELPALSSQIREITQQADFSTNLLKIFKNSYRENSLPTRDTIAQFNFILKLSPSLLLKNISLKEFKELSKIFSPLHSSKEQNSLNNGIINTYYADEMKPFYLNVKQRYTTDFIENLIVNKVKRDIEVLKELPQEALDVIQFIEITFKNIQKNSHNTLQDIDQLHLMVEKRIPEVVSKYLTIDPDYRITLKNMEGKNAQELMIDSLQNISSIFQEVYKALNQENLHSLSAINKYTKSNL